MKLMTNDGTLIDAYPCKNNKIPRYLAKLLMRSTFKIPVCGENVVIHRSKSIYHYFKLEGIWYYTSNNEIFNATNLVKPIDYVARRMKRALSVKGRFSHIDAIACRSGSNHHERNDCTVIALSKVLDMPYSDVHSILASHGRVNGQGYALSFHLVKFGEIANRKFVQVPYNQVSLNSFTKFNLKGKFLVFTRRHVQAVIDGVCYDAGEFKKNSIVYHVYQLVEEESYV